MKKKKAIRIGVLLALLLLLFPIMGRLKDGGSIRFQSLTYTITRVHALVGPDEPNPEGKEFHEGLVVEILGRTVYDNVQ